MNCGSSSTWAARSSLPTRVTRPSALPVNVGSPMRSAFATIVRSFHSANGRPPLPQPLGPVEDRPGRVELDREGEEREEGDEDEEPEERHRDVHGPP